MKFNMETVYVPVASVTEKRNMVMDWENTSDKVFKCSVVSFFLSLLSGLVLASYGEKLLHLSIISSVVVLIGGFFARKWKMVGYVGVLISLAINVLWFYLGLPEATEMKLSVIAATLVNIAPCIFALRCIYNYNTVFKELKKCKGFPDFILNTADIFGDKMYIKDKEPEGIEHKYKASFNAFATEKMISEEEFFRSQNLKVELPEEPETKNIGTHNDEKETNKKRKYKYGKSILGYEIIFHHDELDEIPYWEKAMLMGKWRDISQSCETRIDIFSVLIFVSIMAMGLGGSPVGMLKYLVYFIILFGISCMKLNELAGPFIVLGGMASLFVFNGNGFGLAFVLGAIAMNPYIIISPIKFLLNYKTYKKLSVMEGFPTFMRTAGEEYGKDIYILEERPEPLKKKGKEGFITIDIGYDEPAKKKEEKGWNAFDYMDEQKEKENND